MNPQIVQIFVVALVVLAIGFRMWRASRASRLRIERMWIAPVIIVFLLGSLMFYQPPPMDPLTYGVLAVAVILGLVAGYYRGRLVRITIDPATHALTSQQSPWGVILLVVILGGRLGIRYVLSDAREVMGVPVVTVVDAVTVLFAGNIVGFALERWLRARKLLADAIAAKAAGKAMPGEVTQAHAGDAAEPGRGQ